MSHAAVAVPFTEFNPTKPDVSKLPCIGQCELAGVDIFRSWLARMTALGQPPRRRAAWAGVLRGVQANLGITDKHA